jgi:hypothetical protein
MADRYPARWACFLGDSRCSTVPLGGISNVLSQREMGPLGGTFMEGVTVIIRSVRCGTPIYIKVSSSCSPFHILPSLRSFSPRITVRTKAKIAQREMTWGFCHAVQCLRRCR